MDCKINVSESRIVLLWVADAVEPNIFSFVIVNECESFENIDLI